MPTPWSCLLPVLALLLLAHPSPAAAKVGAAKKRHVRWYMAAGALADVDLNNRFLAMPERRAAITGAYACCNFVMMNGTTGAVLGDVAGNLSVRFSPFLQHGLTVHAHGMVNEEAIQSGAALRGVSQLAEFVRNNGIDGLVMDFEPLDSSAQLAQKYATYLKAAAAAVHALPGKKELGLNIADWTVISPSFWPLYNQAGVDFFATMTPTYSFIYSAWPYVTSLAQQLQPLGRVDVGLASTLQPSGPPGGRCQGKPFNSTSPIPSCGRTPCYPTAKCNSSQRDPVSHRWPSCPWTAPALQNLLDFAGAQGISHASVWRSDIDCECQNGTASWLYTVLARWIAEGGSGSSSSDPAPTSLKTSDAEAITAVPPTALSLLRELPALPVPHYSWSFCHMEYSCTADFMANNLPWSDGAVMTEFARITHSLSTYAGLHIYSNLTTAEIDTVWEKLAAGVSGTDATIAVQLEIGAAPPDHTRRTGARSGLGSPVRPTDTMLAQLRNATTALARANAKLGTKAVIGTVMVDQEGWGAATKAEITRNNDKVYNVSSQVFGEDVNIQYYGRGMAAANDGSANGFWEPEWCMRLTSPSAPPFHPACVVCSCLCCAYCGIAWPMRRHDGRDRQPPALRFPLRRARAWHHAFMLQTHCRENAESQCHLPRPAAATAVVPDGGGPLDIPRPWLRCVSLCMRALAGLILLVCRFTVLITDWRLDSELLVFSHACTEPPAAGAAASTLAGSEYDYKIPWEYPVRGAAGITALPSCGVAAK